MPKSNPPEPTTPEPAYKFDTREGWLQAAINMFRPTFDRVLADDHLCVGIPSDVRVSCGFPHGVAAENSNILAVTYGRPVTVDKTPQVFICPTYDDGFKVLKVLLHELIHVSDDCESDHMPNSWFVKIAKRLGLVKPFADAIADPFLTLELQNMLGVLGPYPHSRMDLSVFAAVVPVGPNGAPMPPLVGGRRPKTLTSGPKRQVSRRARYGCDNGVCPTSGNWSGEFTRAVVDLAHPICPVCRELLTAR